MHEHLWNFNYNIKFVLVKSCSMIELLKRVFKESKEISNFIAS